MIKDERIMRRGEVWLADMSLVVGSESGGKNYPVLLIQNDIGNRFSGTTIVSVITSTDKVTKRMPTHVFLDAKRNNLEKDSFAMLEQVRTIDKMRLIKKLTTLKEEEIIEMNTALSVSVGIYEEPVRQLAYA
jgi:mRNA interferase MazF